MGRGIRDSEVGSLEIHTLGLATSSLEVLAENPNWVPSNVGFSIAIGGVTLFSSLAEDLTPTIAIKYVQQTLLKSTGSANPCTVLLMMAFIAWSGTTLPLCLQELEISSGALRAIELVTIYAREPEGDRNERAGAMVNAGVAVLIANSDTYEIPEAEAERLYGAFVPIPHELFNSSLQPSPLDIDISKFVMDSLIGRLISVYNRHDIPAAKAVSTTHLRAVGRIYASQLSASPVVASNRQVDLDETQDRGAIYDLEHVFAQLKQHTLAPMHPASLHALTIGSASLLSTFLLDCELITASNLILRLLEDRGQLSHECLGVLLFAFALSRNDPPGWSGRPLNPQARVIRTLDTIAHYALEIGSIHRHQSTIMINVGLLELLLHSKDYGLSERDLEILQEAIAPVQATSVHASIHPLSPDFDIRLYVLEVYTRKLSTLPDSIGVHFIEDEGTNRPHNDSLELNIRNPRRVVAIDLFEEGPEQDDPSEAQWSRPSDLDSRRTWHHRRKSGVTILGSLNILNVGFTSSVTSGIETELMRDLDVSRIVVILTISLFVVGHCTGPLLWGPLSEQYGRRPIMLLGSVAYTALQIGCAFSPNMMSILVFRFLGGIFAACMLTSTAAVIADIWDRNMGIIILAGFTSYQFMGSVVGPIVGGHISVAGISWRWLFRRLAIIRAYQAGVCTVFLALILPETYAPIIRKKHARRSESNIDDPGFSGVAPQDVRWMIRLKEVLKMSIKLPFQEPVIFAAAFHASFMHGCFYLIFVAYRTVFVQEHNLNAGSTGLMFLPLLGGTCMGAICYLLLLKYGGKRTGLRELFQSELHIYTLSASVWSGLSFFWFGWTSYPSISHLAPAFSGVLFGFNFIILVLSLSNSMFDTDLECAPAALAMTATLSSVFGAGFPLFGLKMYERLNPRIASTILGAIMIVMAHIPFVLRMYTHAKRKLEITPNVSYKGSGQGYQRKDNVMAKPYEALGGSNIHTRNSGEL